MFGSQDTMAAMISKKFRIKSTKHKKIHRTLQSSSTIWCLAKFVTNIITTSQSGWIPKRMILHFDVSVFIANFQTTDALNSPLLLGVRPVINWQLLVIRRDFFVIETIYLVKINCAADTDAIK